MDLQELKGHSKVVEVAALTVLVTFWVIILRTLDFIFIPLSFSLLLFYALGIPLEFLKRFRIPSFFRIVLVVFLVLTVLYLLIRLLSVNVREFQNQLPEYEIKFWEYAGYILTSLDISTEQAKEMYAAFLENFKQADLAPLGTMVQRVGNSFFAFLGNLIWVLLFMVFILTERESMSRRLIKSLGEEKTGPVQDTAARINLAVQRYLGLKTMVSLITGTLVALLLWIAGVHFALMWGVLTFVLNFIPNIGSLVATVPPVAITLFQYGSPTRAIIIAILLTAVQMGVGNILEPKLMGKGLNLSPLVVLLSLLFWGWMWGITGMLLSVPLTAAIKIALEQVEQTRPVAVLMSSD